MPDIDENEMPHGFILSESALYAYRDQDVFQDLISFCSAIPMHLRPLFLIPIRIQTGSTSKIARRVASRRFSDGTSPSGHTDEADLFGTKTFVYDDEEPTVPSSEPGSIFDINDADDMTHHQEDEENQDKNYQTPTDTSYMSDVDLTDSGFHYPYRSPEGPVRHSTILIISRDFRIALKPELLETHAPVKVKDRAKTCSVSLTSYDKRGRVFTFSVDCGNGAHVVRAALTDVDNVAMNCDCEFWRWNGPEYHAVQQGFMLGLPRGTASPPDVRDPDRKYWVCKHAYSVLTRLDDFVSEVVGENWELDDEELLSAIDNEWDKMTEAVNVPLEEAEEDDVDIEWKEPEEDKSEPEPEPEPEPEIEEEFEEEEEPEEEVEEEEPEPEPEPKEEKKKPESKPEEEEESEPEEEE